jgi:hypothetical protein
MGQSEPKERGLTRKVLKKALEARFKELQGVRAR